MSVENRVSEAMVREARIFAQLWFAAEKECEELQERIGDLERAMAAPCPRCGEKP